MRKVVVISKEEIIEVVEALKVIINNYLSHCTKKFNEHGWIPAIYKWIHNVALLINFTNRIQPQNISYYESLDDWDRWSQMIQEELNKIKATELINEPKE